MSALAHNAPGKARALLDEHRAAAPAATSHGNIVAKSKAVTASIFDKSGGLNEVIEVVAHVLRREEMRPILDHLGYSRAAVPLAIDSMIVESIAEFVAKHVDSSFRDLGSHRGGTRSKEAQAAHHPRRQLTTDQVDTCQVLVWKFPEFATLDDCFLSFQKGTVTVNHRDGSTSTEEAMLYQCNLCDDGEVNKCDKGHGGSVRHVCQDKHLKNFCKHI